MSVFCLFAFFLLQVTPCDFPQINNGGLVNEERFRPYFPVSIGMQFIYHCNRGFVTPSGTNWDYIRCTAQGWEPAVPCRSKSMSVLNRV